MTHYNMIGKKWFIYLLLSYALCNTIGVIVIQYGLGKVGFAAIPYTRAAFLLCLAAGLYFYFLPVSLLEIKNIRKINLSPFDKIVLSMMVLLTAVSFLLGIANQNFNTYLFTDCIYLLIGLLLYLYTRLNKLSLNIQEKGVRKIIVLMGLFLLILRMVGIDELLPSFFFFLCALLIYSFHNNEKMNIFLALIPLGIIAPSLNRTSLLAVIVLFFTLFIPYFFQRKLLKNLLIVAPLILLIIGVKLLFDNIDIVDKWELMQNPLGQRVSRTIAVFSSGQVDLTEDISIQQRVYEAQMVVDNLNQNPINWLFGTGSGATVDMSLSEDASVQDAALLGEESVHNIHFLPFMVLFRYGIVGMLVLLSLMVHLYRQFTVHKDLNILIPTLASLALLFYSMTASSILIVEPLLWISLALIESRRQLLNETSIS